MNEALDSYHMYSDCMTIYNSGSYFVVVVVYVSRSRYILNLPVGDLHLLVVM